MLSLGMKGRDAKAYDGGAPHHKTFSSASVFWLSFPESDC